MVANEGLEEVVPINQVPGTDGLMSPPKDMKVALLCFRGKADRRKIPVA